jgi:hypothetical protein
LDLAKADVVGIRTQSLGEECNFIDIGKTHCTNHHGKDPIKDLH